MTGWMIDTDDPARLEIVERAKTLEITGSPDKAAHALGTITLADGKVVQAHVVHAVDPVITDGTHVVMINRKNDPGMGKPALPGGLIDPAKGGGVESAIQAAAREAMEEVGIDLGKAQSTLIGTRNMDRPFDVRVAANDSLKEKYGIKEGDIFMVSTQAVRFDVPDLVNTSLTAGDDAAPGSARRVRIDSLTRNAVGIPDHFDMIIAALARTDIGARPAATLAARGHQNFQTTTRRPTMSTSTSDQLNSAAVMPPAPAIQLDKAKIQGWTNSEQDGGARDFQIMGTIDVSTIAEKALGYSEAEQRRDFNGADKDRFESLMKSALEIALHSVPYEDTYLYAESKAEDSNIWKYAGSGDWRYSYGHIPPSPSAVSPEKFSSFDALRERGVPVRLQAHGALAQHLAALSNEAGVKMQERRENALIPRRSERQDFPQSLADFQAALNAGLWGKFTSLKTGPTINGPQPG
jgi:8-oxo-dGTP pyrophosphatase MutT (NUDIX family)